ncbi:MAG: hypothetical protein IPJ95_16055 [Gemmatimonadetes bacterium]|nr:hypothetical protein [Gemmatimonadota bacterium]
MTRQPVWFLAALGLLLVTPPQALTAQDEVLEAAFSVAVDSAHHDVVLTIGPFVLPSMAPGGAGGHAHAGHDEAQMPQFNYKFAWPVGGTGRGFRMELRDAEGKKVSQRVLHHLQIINQDRRQLLLPMQEKMMAVGRETPNIMLPNTIGLPLAAGTRLRLNIMWHNETPRDIEAVWMTLRIRYSPENLVPRPTLVLPLSLDVADMKGRPNTFTIPPGDHQITREFRLPVSVRLIGATGHLHDWGQELRLEDAETGRVLTRVRTDLDAAGRIRAMPVKLYGIVGDGLRLRANHRYRIVAQYHNPTGQPLPGAMGHFNGLVSVSDRDLARWPRLGAPDIAYLDEGAWRAEYRLEPPAPVAPADPQPSAP